jgi:hypothetical protein
MALPGNMKKRVFFQDPISGDTGHGEKTISIIMPVLKTDQIQE